MIITEKMFFLIGSLLLTYLVALYWATTLEPLQ